VDICVDETIPATPAGDTGDIGDVDTWPVEGDVAGDSGGEPSQLAAGDAACDTVIIPSRAGDIGAIMGS
jgi:hypothetical protein